MDVQMSMLIALFLAMLCLGANAMSIPSEHQLTDNDLELAGDEIGEEKRAMWLETRELEKEFKELVFLAIRDLALEGRLDKDILNLKGDVKDKRGRWQGFCFRRTKSGRFLPYICWKGGNK